MASVAWGLNVPPAAPGTTTWRVRHTPWTAAFGSAADGAAVLPATIATISAPHEITIFDCVVMESSLGLSDPTRVEMNSHRQSHPRCAEAQAQRRAEAAMARNGAPMRYSHCRHDHAFRTRAG